MVHGGIGAIAQTPKTDYLDLWQLHRLFPQELDTIFSSDRDSSLEEAMQQKLVRFAGITGHHDPNVIAEAPLSIPHHAYSCQCRQTPSTPLHPAVLPVAQQQNVCHCHESTGLRSVQAWWAGGYASGYTLSQPGVQCCVIAAETVAQPEQNVSMARAFQPLSAQEIAAIEQLTAAVWQDSTFFCA